MPVVGVELILIGSKVGEALVVARGKSGEGGRFRLDRPADLAATKSNAVPTLWAYAPGHRAAVMKYPGAFPGADETVRVVLVPPRRRKSASRHPTARPSPARG